MHNRNACSSCENAFLLSCQFIEGHPAQRVEIYMGDLPAEAEPVEGLKTALGIVVWVRLGLTKL